MGHLVLQMTRYDEVHKLAEARQGVAGGQDCAREIGENEGSEISILNGDLATFVFSMFLRTIIEEILRFTGARNKPPVCWAFQLQIKRTTMRAIPNAPPRARMGKIRQTL